MQQHFNRRWRATFVACACAAASVLAGCGGSDDDDGPRLSVPTLAEGAYHVSMGEGSDLRVGSYYASAQGERLLLLQGDDGTLQQVLHQAAGAKAWKVVQGSTPTEAIRFSTEQTQPAAAVLPLSSSVGRYDVRSASGARVTLAVDAQGQITTVASDQAGCAPQGQLATSTLPQALKVSWSQAACLGGADRGEGLWLRDADDAPALWRMFSTDGSAPALDIWLFAAP